jgi:hypothetical protein
LLLLSGHLWIFPRSLAQGWDCTMTHYPYFELRKEAMKRIDFEHIPLQNIASAFPNNHNIQYIDFSENNQIFAEYEPNKSDYILYSNIYNQFNTKTINEINRQYFEKWKIQKGYIEMTLLKRK